MSPEKQGESGRLQEGLRFVKVKGRGEKNIFRKRVGVGVTTDGKKGGEF